MRVLRASNDPLVTSGPRTEPGTPPRLPFNASGDVYVQRRVEAWKRITLEGRPTLRSRKQVAGDVDYHMGPPGSHQDIEVTLTRCRRRANRNQDTVGDCLARREIQRARPGEIGVGGIDCQPSGPRGTDGDNIDEDTLSRIWDVAVGHYALIARPTCGQRPAH